MKQFLLLLVFPIISCSQVENKTVERQNEPDVINVDDTDSAMNNAILKAKKTFKIFEIAIQNDENQTNAYSLKQSFPTSNGNSEHIWISQIVLFEGQYVGIVGNVPLDVPTINFGDTFSIDEHKISDWLIVDPNSGKARGGYTIKVLRDRMSESEKLEFDRDYGLIFE